MSEPKALVGRELENVLEDLNQGLRRSFNNHIEEERHRMGSMADINFLYSHGYSTVTWFDSILTYTTEKRNTAIAALKKTGEMCNKRRKKTNTKKYDTYTDEEIHAELCYAESLFMKTLIAFFADENWSKFMKSGMKIRKFYQAYKECYLIAKNRPADNSPSDRHFRSGVHFGVGAFYLLMSLLPSKALKLVRIFGYNRDMKYALQELNKGYEMTEALRSPFCLLVLLAYHLLLHYLVHATDCDFEIVGQLLNTLNTSYPKGTFTYLYNGRLELVKGNLEKAIAVFNDANASQNGWRQIHFVSYWYQMLCYGFLCDWKNGAALANHLFKNNLWSKALCAYLKAAYMLMEKNTLSEQDHEEIKALMKSIPEWKRKVAGRSPPIEKFVSKKSKRYLECNDLVIPALELLYYWNAFSMIERSLGCVDKILLTTEKALNSVDSKGEAGNKFYWEDRSTVLLVKAACLRLVKRYSESEVCLKQILDAEKKMKKDKQVMPFTMFEYGLLHKNMGRDEEAIVTLDKVLTKYKGYLLEARLQRRAGTALKELRREYDEESKYADELPDLPTDDE